MGKLEKVIVLSVLFVIAVILVVSLTTDNPIDKKNVSILGQPGPKLDAPATTPGASPALAANPATTAPATLLSSNVGQQPIVGAQVPALGANPAALGTGAPATTTAPNALPAGSILVTQDGLAESYLPDMRFYTWQPNDTFRGIANTYYGDWTKLTLLRRANEGRKNVQPGEKILVPMYDLDATPGIAASTTPPLPNASGPAVAKANPPAKAPTAAAPAPTGGKVHVVKEGESLWKIAKAELGNGALWQKIYDANKDTMKSPEALKTGMKLRIP